MTLTEMLRVMNKWNAQMKIDMIRIMIFSAGFIGFSLVSILFSNWLRKDPAGAERPPLNSRITASLAG